MPSPATEAPAKISGKITPQILRETINALIDYARGSHIDDVQTEKTTEANPSVRMIRGDSGVLMRLRVGTGAATGALPPPPGSGTWVLGAVGGVVQWLATTTCTTTTE